MFSVININLFHLLRGVVLGYFVCHSFDFLISFYSFLADWGPLSAQLVSSFWTSSFCLWTMWLFIVLFLSSSTSLSFCDVYLTLLCLLIPILPSWCSEAVMSSAQSLPFFSVLWKKQLGHILHGLSSDLFIDEKINLFILFCRCCFVMQELWSKGCRSSDIDIYISCTAVRPAPRVDESQFLARSAQPLIMKSKLYEGWCLSAALDKSRLGIALCKFFLSWFISIS